MPKRTRTRCPKNVQTVENKFTKMEKSVGDEPLPVDLFEAAKKAMQDLLPKKSKCHYESTYEKFLVWKKIQGAFEVFILCSKAR